MLYKRSRSRAPTGTPRVASASDAWVSAGLREPCRPPRALPPRATLRPARRPPALLCMTGPPQPSVYVHTCAHMHTGSQADGTLFLLFFFFLEMGEADFLEPTSPDYLILLTRPGAAPWAPPWEQPSDFGACIFLGSKGIFTDACVLASASSWRRRQTGKGWRGLHRPWVR